MQQFKESLTFVQISDMFHFSSPTYFSRYVQRTIGLNPPNTANSQHPNSHISFTPVLPGVIFYPDLFTNVNSSSRIIIVNLQHDRYSE